MNTPDRSGGVRPDSRQPVGSRLPRYCSGRIGSRQEIECALEMLQFPGDLSYRRHGLGRSFLSRG